MSFKLLIDECLHPGLVAIAKEQGIVAEFGPYVGKAGWQDHNLVPFAIENNYIIVTNNRRDFLKLYLQHDLHGGIIILVPRADRRKMDELFSLALSRLIEMNEDLVNKAMEVLGDGSIHVRDWNLGTHDLGHIKGPRWSCASPSLGCGSDITPIDPGRLAHINRPQLALIGERDRAGEIRRFRSRETVGRRQRPGPV